MMLGVLLPLHQTSRSGHQLFDDLAQTGPVNTCVSLFLGNNCPNRDIQKSRLGKSTTNGKNRRRDGSGEEQLVRKLAGRALPEHIACREAEVI